jgi:hypothetical protein
MNQKYLIIVILVLLIALGGAGLYIQFLSGGIKRQSELPYTTSKLPDVVPTPQKNTPVENSTTTCKVVHITSPLPNTTLNFPVTITGTIDRRAGCAGWGIDEGRAGTVDLEFYDAGTWRTISKNADLSPDSLDNSLINITTTIKFDNGGIGLPTGQKMRFVIKEEQGGSGLPGDYEQIEIPFTFGTTNTDTGLHPNQ